MSNSNLDKNIFCLQAETVANPGAGNDFTYAVNDNCRIQVVGLWFDLTTDANVANRLVVIRRTDPAHVSQFSPSFIVQPDSLTWRYYFSVDPSVMDFTAVDLRVFCCLSDDLFLEGNDSLTSYIYNRQAADTFSTIRIAFHTQYNPIA